MSTRRITRDKRFRLALPVGLLALAAVSAAIVAGGSNAASAAAPTNTGPPTVSGSAQEGQTLVGHRGQWTGSPTDYNDFWVRCNKDRRQLREHQRRPQPKRLRALER